MLKNAVYQKTTFDKGDWQMFLDHLLDSFLEETVLNPVLMFLSAKWDRDPYWIRDCFKYRAALHKWPSTNEGRFFHRFGEGKDWWWQAYKMCEDDMEEGPKKLFGIVSTFV